MTLTETKNKVAQDLGYDDWKELVKDQSTFGDAWFDLIVTNVAELHAIEKVKDALSLAESRFEIWSECVAYIDSESVKTLETELIENIKKRICCSDVQRSIQ